eukprot:gene7483-15321_t
MGNFCSTCSRPRSNSNESNIIEAPLLPVNERFHVNPVEQQNSAKIDGIIVSKFHDEIPLYTEKDTCDAEVLSPLETAESVMAEKGTSHDVVAANSSCTDSLAIPKFEILDNPELNNAVTQPLSEILDKESEFPMDSKIVFQPAEVVCSSQEVSNGEVHDNSTDNPKPLDNLETDDEHMSSNVDVDRNSTETMNIVPSDENPEEYQESETSSMMVASPPLVVEDKEEVEVVSSSHSHSQVPITTTTTTAADELLESPQRPANPTKICYISPANTPVHVSVPMSDSSSSSSLSIQPIIPTTTSGTSTSTSSHSKVLESSKEAYVVIPEPEPVVKVAVVAATSSKSIDIKTDVETVTDVIPPENNNSTKPEAKSRSQKQRLRRKLKKEQIRKDLQTITNAGNDEDNEEDADADVTELKPTAVEDTVIITFPMDRLSTIPDKQLWTAFSHVVVVDSRRHRLHDVCNLNLILPSSEPTVSLTTLTNPFYTTGVNNTETETKTISSSSSSSSFSYKEGKRALLETFLLAAVAMDSCTRIKNQDVSIHFKTTVNSLLCQKAMCLALSLLSSPSNPSQRLQVEANKNGENAIPGPDKRYNLFLPEFKASLWITCHVMSRANRMLSKIQILIVAGYVYGYISAIVDVDVDVIISQATIYFKSLSKMKGFLADYPATGAPIYLVRFIYSGSASKLGTLSIKTYGQTSSAFVGVLRHLGTKLVLPLACRWTEHVAVRETYTTEATSDAAGVTSAVAVAVASHTQTHAVETSSHFSYID